MVLDYTWERREELIRAEEYEDGKREGEKLGRIEGEKLGRIEGEKLGRIEGEKLGRTEGERSHERYLISKWFQKGKTVSEMAEDLDKPEEYVREILSGMHETIKTEKV